VALRFLLLRSLFLLFHFACISPHAFLMEFLNNNNQAFHLPAVQELNELFFSPDQNEVKDMLVHHHHMVMPEACPECGANYSVGLNDKFQCNSKLCRKRFTLWENTIFANAHLSKGHILHILCLWAAGCNHSTIRQMTHHDFHTVSHYMRLIRMAVAVDAHAAPNRHIGGEGIVVQIDESKFGKVKYHRGHHVEGVWVVGGVEITPERGLFAVPVPNRNSETLWGVIQNFVLPGSIIYTDCWRAYRTDGLLEMGMMEHQTVNHSVQFVDPITGVNTNCIEGNWHGFKLRIPNRARTAELIENHLLEHIWRRKYSAPGSLWPAVLRVACRMNIEVAEPAPVPEQEGAADPFPCPVPAQAADELILQQEQEVGQQEPEVGQQEPEVGQQDQEVGYLEPVEVQFHPGRAPQQPHGRQGRARGGRAGVRGGR
jgi:transposase-like protein